MSTAETIISMKPAQQIPITGVADIEALGKIYAQSGMLGQCNPARGAAVVTICYEKQISLLDFLQSYHLQNDGKITMRADRMLSNLQALGGECKWVEYTDKKAVAKFTYRENQNTLVEYTIEEATEAGLIKPKSNWEKDPAAQLRARCITRGVRMVCPAAVAGAYTPEELGDIAEDGDGGGDVVVDVPTPVPAQAADDDATPFDVPPPEPKPKPDFDYTICPVGKYQGKHWADIETDTLTKMIQFEHPMIEPDHYNAMRDELERR